MISIKNLFKLRHHEMVEKDVLDGLFAAERSTLITLMLLETILLYILVPLLGNSIIAWYGITISISLWRFYNAYDYEKHPEHNEPIIWHKKFVVQVWLTALLFSILALFAMPRLDAYYQLFTFIVLVGISSGAVKALDKDHRTAIGYLIILLFPLSVEMLLLMRQDTYILAFLVAIYFFTQVSVLLHAYEQSINLKEREQEAAEARELLHEKQELVQRFFEQASEGIFSYDRELNILDCNNSFLELFDLEKGSVIGTNLERLPNKNLVAIIRESLTEGTKSYSGIYYAHGDRELWIEAKCSSIHNQKGEIVGGMGLIEDKTMEHMAQQELEYLVFHDPLTSVSNRRGFRQYMNELVRHEKHATRYSLLFFLDLNRFKQINDVFGHETGDRVLVETVQRLKHLLDSTANLTRLGGDEFCIVIPFVDISLEKTQKEIKVWIGKIEKIFSRPFVIDGRVLDVGCSIGVVTVQPNEKNVDEIVHHADISMFQAKRGRETRVSIYDPKMGEKYKEMYALQHDLDSALKNEQFELFFQPIVSINGNFLRAAEALIRWRHPKKGLIPPSDFLPLAIKFGQIVDIDELVLDMACRQISEWKKENCFNMHYLSVNIDARLLLKNDFTITLTDKFKRYGVANNEIKLEITENSLVDNFENAREVIKELYENGIECAIDDFGTGYSSLSYLKKLSFSVLKIDREFIKDMMDRIENIFLVRTIMDMGEKLNYHIIVEGIETEKQRKTIAHINPAVDYQGYFFSPPVSAEEFCNSFLKRDETAEEKS